MKLVVVWGAEGREKRERRPSKLDSEGPFGFILDRPCFPRFSETPQVQQSLLKEGSRVTQASTLQTKEWETKQQTKAKKGEAEEEDETRLVVAFLSPLV